MVVSRVSSVRAMLGSSAAPRPRASSESNRPSTRRRATQAAPSMPAGIYRATISAAPCQSRSASVASQSTRISRPLASQISIPSLGASRTLLGLFSAIHAPTTFARKEHAVGSQYRWALFVVDGAQRREAQETIARLEAAKLFEAPIVTQVVALGDWYPAEPHHQRYFERHPHQGYCAAVVAPKVAKFRRQFAPLHKG